MQQQLPPPALVETWLEIIHNKDMPLEIVYTRKNLLCRYLGSIELACLYVEQNQFKRYQVS